VRAGQARRHFIDAFGQRGEAAAAEDGNALLELALPDAGDGFSHLADGHADAPAESCRQQDAPDHHQQHRACAGPEQIVALTLQPAQRDFHHYAAQRLFAQLSGYARGDGRKSVVELKAAGTNGLDQTQGRPLDQTQGTACRARRQGWKLAVEHAAAGENLADVIDDADASDVVFGQHGTGNLLQRVAVA